MLLRFPLHHSNTSYEGIYISQAPCMRCVTISENGTLYSTNLTRGLLAGVISTLSKAKAASTNQLLFLNLSCKGWLSLETIKCHYTISVQFSARNESDYCAACNTFEISRKYIYIHNSTHMHTASVTGVDIRICYLYSFCQYIVSSISMKLQC